METEVTKAKQPLRPAITEYQDPVSYLRDMIEFRKASEKSFSVLKACRSLRRVSPALVSLIMKGQRKITLDRLDELAKLLALNSQEKFFFKNWLQRTGTANAHDLAKEMTIQNRREVTTHILKDWINVYVKDSFQIPQIQKNPKLIYQTLGNYASPQRIDKAIQFLLREGHLRKTMEGRIVVETNLAVADPQVSSQKIRQFHKGALGVAKVALDLFPPSERYANTLTLPLNEKSYAELIDMVQEFAMKLQDFAAQSAAEGDRLYQFVLNVSPTGGKLE